jgi:signal transduction protein with GAF and PtsI domain
MGNGDRLSRAASAGLLPDDATCTALLESIVDSARRSFGAAACSITLLDETTEELVFAAVAGEGADRIVGDRFPADVGIAGWVLTSQQPIAVQEVEADPRFAADVAARTGYVPNALMAAPLFRGEHAVGVFSVLDRDDQALPELAAMDLLSACARQASIAAELIENIRRVAAVARGEDPELAAVARLASALEGLEAGRRDDGLALLDVLERVLRRG